MAFAAAVCVFVLTAAPTAAAQSFSLPAADVQIRVEPDGSLRVEERITFSFDGPFTGAFREIPLRGGEAIDEIYVREGDREYAPGASAELGSSGAPDTYGVARTAGGMRIVWHYEAADEPRTFTLGYRLRGLAVAYDDVVDVNFQVWGDEWRVGVGQLTATLVLPGPAEGDRYRAWGQAQSRIAVRAPNRQTVAAAGR